jgi:hypothetical protein
MWIVTNFGFFSVVRKPDDVEGDMLTIRGRVRADLEALKSTYLPDAAPITEDKRADYRYRFKTTAFDFGVAMNRIALEIDYDNFKESVAVKQGWNRHDIYSQVWSVLRHLYCCDQEQPKEGGSV